MTPNIVSLSFGQTSAFMLRRLMDKHGADFEKRFTVVFENTGKEHDATLDFGHEIETRWGVPVVWLEYCRVPATQIPLEAVPDGRKRDNLKRKQEQAECDHWFKIVSHKTAKRYFQLQGNPFDVLLDWATVPPNRVARHCSVQLKIRTRDRYLRSLGIGEFQSYIGIRIDEADRVTEILANIDKYETPNFPLVDDKISKCDVDSFWKRQPFRLEIPNYEGNCRFCFLKARWKRVRLAKQAPAAAAWAFYWESVFRARGVKSSSFRDGESWDSIIRDSEHPELNLSEGDIPCSCAVGGYRNQDNEEDV